MNILQCNHTDLMGQRFNGFDLNVALMQQGHQVCQYVFQKESTSPQVSRIPDIPKLREKLKALEYRHSFPSLFLPYGKVLPKTEIFQKADVVHYHLIHNHMLAIPDFPALTMAKSSVWTWHDPWAVTGHCVHPGVCQGWKYGCNPCPDLEANFPLQKDHAGLLWKIKLEAYQKMNIDIVVASDFMLDFAKNGPLGQCFQRIHKIPFGVHLERFGKKSKNEARKKFNITQEDFVIALRNDENPYKGIEYVEKMLNRWMSPKNVTILTLGSRQLPKRVVRRFHVVQLGWSNDPLQIADFYTACDVFLMPSTAESFGLMAIEAMASSRPVICFEGTALPEVTFAPECGIALSVGDTDALLKSITSRGSK